MAIIRITNLKLRTIIGINDWERKKKQDVIINIAIQTDANQASISDNIKDTIDYKLLTKHIIKEVEASKYYLLEKLCRRILEIVLQEKRAYEATVRLDKPGALRFCDSVSVELTHRKNE
jgi:D-erythro-7,8-dihydroneopterin triphosphate epimerase